MQALRSAAGSCAALAGLQAAVFAERLCSAGTSEGSAPGSPGRHILHWRPPASSAWAPEPAVLHSAATAACHVQDGYMWGRGDPKTKRGKVSPRAAGLSRQDAFFVV